MIRSQLAMRQIVLAATFLVLWTAAGCQPAAFARPTPSPVTELRFYSWEGDMPQEVLDAFAAEYGVAVTYLTYESQEEAIENLRAGEIYDVVVMESSFIPLLIAENLLAELDHRHMPNFKNISPNFRDLIFDPGNRYTVPFNWGMTFLVIRADLLSEPVTRWADLWQPAYRGRAGIWAGVPRDVIALTLKSLGYSANSEDPAELAAAQAHLLAIRQDLLFLEEFDPADSSAAMASGQVVVSMGYANDVLAGRTLHPAITHVFPQEGTLLWTDAFVIPANSPNKHTAELFLNFLLRPEVSAEITNANYYLTANELAMPFVDPAIAQELFIQPPDEVLRQAEMLLPLSLEGQRQYDELWDRFLAAGQ